AQVLVEPNYPAASEPEPPHLPGEPAGGNDVPSGPLAGCGDGVIKEDGDTGGETTPEVAVGHGPADAPPKGVGPDEAGPSPGPMKPGQYGADCAQQAHWDVKGEAQPAERQQRETRLPEGSEPEMRQCRWMAAIDLIRARAGELLVPDQLRKPLA